MNLEEFVEVSLKQIISGVKKAQESTKLRNKHLSEADLINPEIMYGADSAPKGKYFATIQRNLVHFVEFDVAVSADSSIEAKGGFSLKVAGLAGVEAGAGGSEKESSISRVKFNVPIQLPRTEDQNR